jgi:hypothetical protein
MARSPNGRGVFVERAPTFGRSNDAISAVTGGEDGAEYMLAQNNPNPVTTASTFAIRIARSGPVKLTIHDLFGRVVATVIDKELSAGDHSILWMPHSLPPGTYFYTLEAGPFHQTRKLVIGGSE